jgi:mannose/fructose/N-acetylgalactosamine-specific phosphotransferase system component IIC
MFTTGQLIFAALFFIAFVVIIFLQYKKDKNLHAKNYKGVKWIGLGFMIFIITLFVIKFLLKN